MRTEGYIDNDGVRIHYARTDPSSASELPLVMIPGMTEAAEEYARYFAESLILNTVCISLRGRGKSDAPDHGYSFKAQLSDVGAVIDHLDLHHFMIVGFSVGASFAIAYTLAHQKQVQGLVVVDYPPHYPLISHTWIRSVTEPGRELLPPHVALELVRESRRVVFSQELPLISCPTLVIRGAKSGSLLPAEIARLYIDRIPQCTMLVLENMSHDPFETTGKDFMEALAAFKCKIASGL